MSTRASSSTATATATAGSTSLTTATAFASLTPADIVFFDNIIATTAPGPAEFATLKHAYQQATSSHTETESPHRWNTLLSLVQVRGRTWHERWDAVRLSLGLHPLPSSPSASSSSSLRSPSASASSTGAHSETRRHDASPSRVHFTPTARQRTLDTLTARAGSLALAAASSASAGGARTPRQTQKQPQSQEQDTDDDLFAQDSDDDDDDYEYQPPTRPRQPTTPASASTTARTRTPATARSTSGKAVLADLIRAVKSISIDNQNQASNNNSATPAPSRKRPSLRSSHAELSRDDGDQDADADDSLILPPARAARIERNKHLATNPPPHPHLSAHIASVVQRARAEREALRHQHSPMDNEVLAGAKEKEIEENAAADEYARRVLLIKSLAWWLTQTRRSFARQTHVSNMHKNLLLRRVLSHWITLSHTRRAEEERAARIDQVRVIVTAWNGWMEKVRGRWSTKKEERREAIRTAFKGVVHLRGKNALTLALKTWKEKYDSRLADAVRREHLQRGALALWTLAASKMASLHAIEDRIVQRREKGRKRELWVLWKVRVREAEWERRERGRRKRALWEWWKKAAMLNNMASILERHRLLQSSLSSWLRAHTHHVHLAHSHAVFTRRSLRSLKKRTLAQWATALDALREKEEEALRFRVGSDLAHLRRCMALWMGREREMLFRRVSEGRSVSSAWGYWRKTLVEREGRYELQESILTERVRLGTLKTGWTALVSAFTLQNALGTAADALARKVSVERAFAKWRAVGRRREAEWAEAEERDTKVLVEGAWSTWVERRRGKVLERMERGRQEGLMRSAFAAWKAQTTQKQSLRLAEIRARTHDAALTQRHFLHRWTSRIIKVRNEYYDAGVRADGKLKRAAWVRWKDVLVAHGEMVGLVECFREVKAQGESPSFLHCPL
ncbi:unnamed protein product [Tilletia caries]|nr:hypothetical protein CF328_g5795 [Tilletia controversa]CAD6952571.1 unnamed protein product [Tilletia caries]